MILYNRSAFRSVVLLLFFLPSANATRIVDFFRLIFNPTELAEELINTVLASDLIQEDLEFTIESGCTTSTVNDLQFCDAASYSASESASVSDQDCLDGCQDAHDVCTIPCFFQACFDLCDDARTLCRSLCGLLTASASFSAGLSRLRGLGDARVTDITRNWTFLGRTFTVDIGVPSLVAGYFVNAEVKAGGITLANPSLSGNVVVLDVDVSATADLSFSFCDGIVLEISDLTINNVEWLGTESGTIATSFLISLGTYATPFSSLVTEGITAANDAINTELNSLLDDTVTPELNSALADSTSFLDFNPFC